MALMLFCSLTGSGGDTGYQSLVISREISRPAAAAQVPAIQTFKLKRDSSMD